WAAASQLSLRRLIRIFDFGECEVDGVSLLYLVMGRAEGNLATVLPERSLTEVETREMLEPALDALAYLHEHGFVHGGVRPSNIMAVGDEVKLASDCIGRAGPIDGRASTAGDVWSLGVTLVQALTQHPPDLVLRNGSEPAIPEPVSEPFRDIVRNCLRRDPESRWTVSRIASRLREP